MLLLLVAFFAIGFGVPATFGEAWPAFPVVVAEAPPDTIKPWLECAVWLLGAALIVKKLFFDRKPPIGEEIALLAKQVDLSELENKVIGCATKEELSKVQNELGKKIEDQFHSLDGKRSKSIGGLHEHLTATKESVAALRATTETHTQMLARMEQNLMTLVRRKE